MPLTASRLRLSAFAATALVGLAGTAVAADACSARRATCESACTPDRVARYHFGSPARCTASCYPRWSACMATGVWADLERVSNGWYERLDSF